MKRNRGKIVKYSLLALCVVFAAIQLVPYGRSPGNPPVVREPGWDSPQTRELARRACFDCHSNETKMPWYGWVAPASWLILSDIQGGRAALNFSEWQGSGRRGESPAEMAKEIAEAEMPPLQYRLFHPASRLTDAEKRQLADGLAATAQQSGAAAR